MSLLVIGVRQSLIFVDKKASENIKVKLILTILILAFLSAFLALTNLHSLANLSKISSYLGKKVSVEYFVSYPCESKRGHIFLKGRGFTVVIFEEAVSRFPANSVKLYENKKIRINGILKNYKNHPEIVVSSPK